MFFKNKEKLFIPHDLNTTPRSTKWLYEFYNQFKGEGQKEIHLDFSRIKFIDANLCALFNAVFYKLSTECGHQFFADLDDLKNRFEVFTRNGFLSSKSRTQNIIDERQTTVRLTNFETGDDDIFCAYLEEDLFAHRALKKKPKIKEQLMDHFLEVFANIQLHAQTDNPIFACGQYYPNLGILKFTLVDIGIGFLAPISQHTKGKVDTAEKAIQWALNGNTTKTDAPGGLGLSALRTFFSKNNHSMQLITDGKCWGNKCGLVDLGKEGYFSGTTIHLEFDCN